jgi:hypothetical protein
VATSSLGTQPGTVEYFGAPFRIPTGGNLPMLTRAPLCDGVTLIGGFNLDFGDSAIRVAAKNYLAAYKSYKDVLAMYGPGHAYAPPVPYAYTQEMIESALDKVLDGLKGLVIATTPSWLAQYRQACLLKARGFELLNGMCYPNCNYPVAKYTNREDVQGCHPGNPDGYSHWIHIWIKDLGGVENCGELLGVKGATDLQKSSYAWSLNCCGALYQYGTAVREGHPKNKLAIAQCRRGVRMAEGWKRFASYADYKFGHNFELVGGRPCPHKFDLSEFDGWDGVALGAKKPAVTVAKAA